MLGSAYDRPSFRLGAFLAQMLADRGWGPVRMAAGVGFQAGKMVANNPGANMSLWITTSAHWGSIPRSSWPASAPTTCWDAVAASIAR